MKETWWTENGSKKLSADSFYIFKKQFLQKACFLHGILLTEAPKCFPKVGLHWSVRLLKKTAWGQEQSVCVHYHAAILSYTLVQGYHAKTHTSCLGLYAVTCMQTHTTAWLQCTHTRHPSIMWCCWSFLYLHHRALCLLQRRSAALNTQMKKKQTYSV